jgi:hypothetical protein
MISAMSAAASDMNDAMVCVDVAAHNIANVNTAGFSPLTGSSVEMPEGGVAPVVTAGVPGLGAALPLGGSGTDLAAETVNVILARVAFVASARAFATAPGYSTPSPSSADPAPSSSSPRPGPAGSRRLPGLARGRLSAMLLDPVFWLFVLSVGLLLVGVLGVVVATRRARRSEQLGLPGVSPDLGSDFVRIHELQTQVKHLGDEYDRLLAERDELEAVLTRLAGLLEQADRAAAGLAASPPPHAGHRATR